MKKLSLYIMLSLVLGFTACTEDFNKDVAAPQTWEQEAAQDVNFQIAAAAATYDLNAITDESIDFVKKTSLPVFNEKAEVAYQLQFDKVEGFTGKMVATTVLTGDNYKANTADLQKIVETYYGKKPEARTLYVRIVAAVKEADGQIALIRSNTVTLAVTPKAPVIETEYYVTGDLVGGWGPLSLVLFAHSGKDVYEDPIFTLMIEAPKDGVNFKIIPKSSTIEGADFWLTALGTAKDGDMSLEGAIIGKVDGKDPGAIKIEKAGWVKITLDMMAYTYKIEPLTISPYLWIPGNHQGWNPTTAPKLYTAKMDMVYTGHAYLNSDFKFTAQPDWGPVEYNFTSFATLSENVTQGGGTNLTIAEGFYNLKVDLTKNSLEAVKTQWGLIGDATPGGWDASTDMVYDQATNCWSVTAELKAGKEFKFRANNSWDINMGGSISKLVAGGSNIVVAEGGNYAIKLYLSNDETSYCTLTKN